MHHIYIVMRVEALLVSAERNVEAVQSDCEDQLS